MLFSSSKKAFLTNQQQAADANKMLLDISPLVVAIYRNKTLFYINKGLNSLSELCLYLLGLACIAFSFIMQTIFPFHIIGEIMSKRIYEEAMTNPGEIQTFSIAMKALVIIIGLLLIFIGMLTRRNGSTKILLQQAGIQLKSVEGYFVQLKENYQEEPLIDSKEISANP